MTCPHLSEVPSRRVAAEYKNKAGVGTDRQMEGEVNGR